MLVEGTITGVSGDRAVVSVVRAGACGRCSESGGCGSVASCQPYVLQNPTSAAVGEVVQVSLPDGGTLKAVVLAYLVPLFGILSGAVIGKLFGFSDLGLFFACFSGGAICMGAVGFSTKRGWVVVAAPRIVGSSRG